MIFFLVSPLDVSAVAFKDLGDLFTYLGLPEKQSKAVPPTRCATVLGILFNTEILYDRSLTKLTQEIRCKLL